MNDEQQHIVIIEDEEMLGRALRDILISEGFTATMCTTGEEGLKTIQSEHPRLVLLDSVLPGIHGIEVLRALTEYRKTHDLKIIILSNIDDPEDLQRAREYDIVDYLIKTDWKLEEIIEKIKKALQ